MWCPGGARSMFRAEPGSGALKTFSSYTASLPAPKCPNIRRECHERHPAELAMPTTALRRCIPARTIMAMPSPLSRSRASTQDHASGQTLAASEQNDDFVHHERGLRAALRLRKKEDDCADEQHQPAPALQKKKQGPYLQLKLGTASSSSGQIGSGQPVKINAHGD